MPSPIITFCSDFGPREYYVGAIKGTILGANPDARIVDISHAIASHDLLEAAFTLLCSYSCFPARTVHLAIVDPGVGSSRRAIIAVTENYYFVAPDNGVLSLVYEAEDVSRVISIEAEHHFRNPVSPTFHGRDIFAPIAAQLSRGLTPDTFGPEIDDYVKLALPKPAKVAEGQVEGIVLHIDKFGNMITNLSTDGAQALLGREVTAPRFRVGEHSVSSHYTYYAEATADEVFSLVGSSGFYEISAMRKPAARMLKCGRGTRVTLTAG